jgi:lysozyme
MKISQAGVDLIKSFEGLSLKAYKVDGAGEKYWTIGYGSYGPHVHEGMVITKVKAEELLKDELERFVKGVDELVKVTINQHQFDALVSFAYNCGLGNLKTSTLLKLVNKKDFKGAANEFDKWTRAGGNVLKGLVRRRAAEQELFTKPVAVIKPKPATKPKPSIPNPNVTFKEGSKSKYVGYIQKAVGIKVDNDFGPKTTTAVKAWQKVHGLKADGIVGPKTFDKMF